MQRGRCLVLLIGGKAGEDAVLRYTGKGTPVLRFSLATDTGRRPLQGEKRSPDWHKVLIVGAKAEDRLNLPRKGDTCYVEGTLRTSPVGTKNSGRCITEVFVGAEGAIKVYYSSASKSEITSEQTLGR